MSHRIRFCFFAHSWISDWNHGNAHFLRGLVRELARQGHEVRCYEEAGSWSMTNLKKEGDIGERAIEQFHHEFPELDVRFYRRNSTLYDLLAEELRQADVVVVHEWTEPEVADCIASLKQRYGFRALFHDTHHRAYTNPSEIRRFRLNSFDGVLAFGERLSQIYRSRFGVRNVWTFHEAADLSHFRPLPEAPEADLLWIGNWADDERTEELEQFFLFPVAELRNCKTLAYGVRYPEQGLRAMAAAGIEYRGYLPSLMAPEAYGRSVLSLHVPRRQYSNGLSGIPTIRVFEALACGATLVCAPWSDVEGLFRPGEDYAVVNSGAEMRAEIARLLRDPTARRQIGAHGRQTILARHTCAHRARQLTGICEELYR